MIFTVIFLYKKSIESSRSRTFIFIIFWILKVLYFLKICPIFVDSVDNFGKRYEKIKILFCPT